jgi:hypothetical protein
MLPSYIATDAIRNVPPCSAKPDATIVTNRRIARSMQEAGSSFRNPCPGAGLTPASDHSASSTASSARSGMAKLELSLAVGLYDRSFAIFDLSKV